MHLTFHQETICFFDIEAEVSIHERVAFVPLSAFIVFRKRIMDVYTISIIGIGL